MKQAVRESYLWRTFGRPIWRRLPRRRRPAPLSRLALRYCQGQGIEIGASADNPFGLASCRNVDYTDCMDTIFKQRELAEWGHAASVDVVGLADELPLPDGGEDYVLTSHVLEHVEDPIGALLEWDRVVRPGGVIFMIVPHKERTFDVNEDRTTLEHVISDIGRKTVDFGPHKHFWVMDDMLHIVQWMRENLSVQWRVLEAHDVDDKTGNGFTIVIRKESERLADEAAA